MIFFAFPNLLNNPAKGGAERLAKHRSAGFADGLQTAERPFARTVLPQLTHEKTVRQHHQVHVPGLALAVAIIGPMLKQLRCDRSQTLTEPFRAQSMP
jgi:hypothetical protein